MKEITFYRSDNELFIFESKEECTHYDRLVPVGFEKLFLKVENAQFALLACDVNETGLTAYLQMQEVTDLDPVCEGQAFHCELWKIRYDFGSKTAVFEIKYGTYDFISSSTDVKNKNVLGWVPFWQPVDVKANAEPQPITPENESKEIFLEYIKTSLTDYFESFYTNKRT